MFQGIGKDIQHFIGLFDLQDWVVFSINVLLMIFAHRIMRALYHQPETSMKFRLSVSIFRVFNLLIIIAFTYYHLRQDKSDTGVGYNIVAIIITLYLCYVVLHILHYGIRIRYGKTREIEGSTQYVETYNSRLLSLFASIFMFIIALVSVIRLLGFESLLQAGGAIGVIGVFLALTQNAWAPDLFSGLIILNSGMMEVGDVIEFNEGDKTLCTVFKTKVFHTELLNMLNNHRIMIKNAKLREFTIHNLSKFASARGLREQLHFKIGYAEDEEKIRDMFELAFQRGVEHKHISIESQFSIEVAVLETGDHAVEWAAYYYTKDVKNLIKTRQLFRELILTTSKEKGISLATPLTHTIAYASAENEQG